MGKRGVEQFSLDELMHFLRESTRMRGKEELINDAVQEFGLKERKSAAASSSDACITPEDMKLFMVKYLQPKVKGLLGIEQIASHSDLCFIPKDKHFPTRHVGSWVCVCTGAALMMVRYIEKGFLLAFLSSSSSSCSLWVDATQVNAWAQALMGLEVPNYSNFTLSTFQLTTSEMEGADGKSSHLCSICCTVSS